MAAPLAAGWPAGELTGAAAEDAFGAVVVELAGAAAAVTAAGAVSVVTTGDDDFEAATGASVVEVVLIALSGLLI